jgi:protein-S-isoprenylcysteine O-methyltransferase Ste14
MRSHKNPKKKAGAGLEHPLCDSIQLVMLILFFAVWGIDSVSYFLFRVSTVIAESVSLPFLLAPAVLSLFFGVYLLLKSHEKAFGETIGQPRLIETGVYSWVRHPMYLGTLMFCLTFVFTVLSILSLGVWIIFLAIYDRMATFEERDLIRILGEKYIAYQRRVPKWCPRPHKMGRE